MENRDNISRRNVVKNVGAGVMGVAGLMSQSASADDRSPSQKQGKDESDGKKQSVAYLRSFDPSDPDERAKAVGHLAEMESREKAEHVLSTLPPKREKGIKVALRNSEGLEFQLSHQQVEHGPGTSSTSDVSTADTSTTFHCKGVLKNSLGGTEGVFDHYVRWDHSGETVENFSHWKKVKTGGWLVYWNGMTTNYIDNRDDHGVSKMAGTFNACITNYGCYLSEEVGSGIWVYPNGHYACNEWNDST